MPAPNVLFLHSHNTGTFIQPYGHAVPTPNLQRLARQGVTFRRAFAAAPTCSPSRAAFMTGMFAHSAGMLGLAHRGFSINDPQQHIANVLRSHGYVTALSGVEHTVPDLAAIGYDRVLSALDTNYPHTVDDADEAEAAVRFLEEAHDAPFFLSVGLNETHRPFPAADPGRHPAEDARYCVPPPSLPDTPETRADTADFKAGARIMDGKFGRVLGALDANGLADDTLVLCFADHGLQFPRNMCNLTDHGSRVYLFARGPGGFSGGRVVDSLVSLIDLVPTVCDVAGFPCPDHVQGTSLRPTLETDNPIHDAVHGEVNYHAAYEPMRTIRTDRYRYVRRYDDRDRPVLPNIDDTPSKTFILDRGWASVRPDREMLFDLAFDPHETNNLAEDPAHRDTLADLGHRLDRWMHETSDPLLPSGHVAAPSGVRVNDPDGKSPREEPDVVP